MLRVTWVPLPNFGRDRTRLTVQSIWTNCLQVSRSKEIREYRLIQINENCSSTSYGVRMSALGIVLIVLLILLLFGGLGGGSVVPYWGYGYGFGHGGIGLLGIILIVLIVLLLMGRL